MALINDSGVFYCPYCGESRKYLISRMDERVDYISDKCSKCSDESIYLGKNSLFGSKCPFCHLKTLSPEKSNYCIQCGYNFKTRTGGILPPTSLPNTGLISMLGFLSIPASFFLGSGLLLGIITLNIANKSLYADIDNYTNYSYEVILLGKKRAIIGIVLSSIIIICTIIGVILSKS